MTNRHTKFNVSPPTHTRSALNSLLVCLHIIEASVEFEGFISFFCPGLCIDFVDRFRIHSICKKLGIHFSVKSQLNAEYDPINDIVHYQHPMSMSCRFSAILRILSISHARCPGEKIALSRFRHLYQKHLLVLGVFGSSIQGCP